MVYESTVNLAFRYPESGLICNFCQDVLFPSLFFVFLFVNILLCVLFSSLFHLFFYPFLRRFISLFANIYHFALVQLLYLGVLCYVFSPRDYHSFFFLLPIFCCFCHLQTLVHSDICQYPLFSFFIVF